MADLDSQRDEAIRFFRSTPRPCAVCHQLNGYMVGPVVTFPTPDGAPGVAALPLMCRHCGGITWLQLGGVVTGEPDIHW